MGNLRFSQCLDEETFKKIEEILPKEDWDKKYDLQMSIWPKNVILFRGLDNIGIVASGCVTDPRLMHGILTTAGIDILAHEPNPKKNESDVNTYHVIFEKKEGKTKRPYEMRVYKEGADIGGGHRPTEMTFDEYVSRLTTTAG